MRKSRKIRVHHCRRWPLRRRRRRDWRGRRRTTIMGSRRMEKTRTVAIRNRRAMSVERTLRVSRTPHLPWTVLRVRADRARSSVTTITIRRTGTQWTAPTAVSSSTRTPSKRSSQTIARKLTSSKSLKWGQVWWRTKSQRCACRRWSTRTPVRRRCQRRELWRLLTRSWLARRRDSLFALRISNDSWGLSEETGPLCNVI